MFGLRLKKSPTGNIYLPTSSTKVTLIHLGGAVLVCGCESGEHVLDDGGLEVCSVPPVFAASYSFPPVAVSEISVVQRDLFFPVRKPAVGMKLVQTSFMLTACLGDMGEQLLRLKAVDERVRPDSSPPSSGQIFTNYPSYGDSCYFLSFF